MYSLHILALEQQVVTGRNPARDGLSFGPHTAL